MQIIHRISIASTPEIRRELAGMGFVVAASGLVTFEAHETHEAWPLLQGWIAKRRALDLVRTKFSKAEIDAAKWLVLVPDWHHGYPQPNELDFGYRKVTYDLSHWCDQCGMGLKQKAPFRMKGEPKWGRNRILQLNWVFDEYFVTPEVWASIFKVHGVRCRPVMNANGAELRTVVQLVIEDEVGVMLDGLPAERCSRCRRTKYLPVTRGPFPPVSGKPPSEMVKSTQYFGSGGSAYNGVLLSRAVARALADEKVRGAFLEPVADGEATGFESSSVT